MNFKVFFISLFVNTILSCIIGLFAYPEPYVPYDGIFIEFFIGGIHGGIFIGNWLLGTFVYDPTQHLVYSAESGIIYKVFFWLSAVGTAFQIVASLFKPSVSDE